MFKPAFNFGHSIQFLIWRRAVGRAGRFNTLSR